MRKPFFQGVLWSAALPLIKLKAAPSLRRMIFLSSLYATIQGVRNPERELVDKLNRVLQITTKDPSAMCAPMMVHEFIWTNVNDHNIVLSQERHAVHVDELGLGSQKFKTEELVRIARYFIDRMPSWLRYDADNVMLDDVQRLVTALPALKAA